MRLGSPARLFAGAISLPLALLAGCGSETIPGGRELRKFDEVDVCRATIASVMYRPVEIIRGNRSGQLVDVSYVRSDDQTTWRFICRYLGNEVQWASIRDDGSQGRWRNQYDVEEKITFSEDVQGEVLSVLMNFADGSVIKKDFSLSAMR